jgi:hypothetical protein
METHAASNAAVSIVFSIGGDVMAAIALSKECLSILDHTVCRAAQGRYCGDSPEMQILVSMGLMESAGKVSWVPDEYFHITEEGRRVLSDFQKSAGSVPGGWESK